MTFENIEALNKYLSDKEQLKKENERYELEFLEILSNLKIYAIKNDKLELLKDYADFELGLKIADSVQKTGQRAFTAEL